MGFRKERIGRKCKLRTVIVTGARGCIGEGCKFALPHMLKQASGVIVNVASLDGLIGINGVSAYASSKWGLRGLTKATALELGRDGILSLIHI